MLIVGLGFGALCACETLDDDMLAEDDASIDEVEQAHTLQYTDKGTVALGVITAGTLVNSSTHENIHRYKYIATAGKMVTFVLEIPSSAGGAWLGLTTSSSLPGTFTIYKKQFRSTTVNRVFFEFKSTTNSTYYLWARQGAHATGSFAYRLGVAAPMCATIRGSFYDNVNTPSSGWWTLFSAKNFPVGSTESPITWMPAVNVGTFTASTRVVMLGNCLSNQATNCGTSDPDQICEADGLGYGPTDNTCTAQNLILGRAGDADGNQDGWYQPISANFPCEDD
jgi:hypothetical protein